MGVNTVKQVLTGVLETDGTLVLNERLDAYRHADDGKHVLLVRNSALRYVAPDDFTIAIDGRGKATLTWLHADSLGIGAELDLGIWQYDSTVNGTSSGGGGGTSGGALETTQQLVKTAVQTLVTAGATAQGQADIVSAVGEVAGLAGTGNGFLSTIATNSSMTGPVPTQGEPCLYEFIEPADTDETLGSGTVGDILVGLMIIPLTKSPGAVSIEDGSTNSVIFAGGADSVGTLHPFYYYAGDAESVSGGWEITTGTNVRVQALYRNKPL